ncbi:MAG: class I SAM-dependent methyltransferase [Candidatus Kariarchaeaceae archaeon]
MINSLRRIIQATKYFNKKYIQILKWGVLSKEDTNYTYELTEENILYMAYTISVVANIDYKIVLNYINEAQNDEVLRNHVISESQRSKFKYVTDLRCDFGRRLGWYAFVRILKPKIVIETGIDKGLGAVLLCSGLLRNKEEGFEGQYYGTDINPEAGYLLSGIYKSIGKILYGDSIKSLEKFDKPVDLFINDSDHSSDYEYKEYLTIKNLLTENSIILGDNSHSSEKLAYFSGENKRNFLFFQEKPKNHWYPGAGIGISYNITKPLHHIE